MGIQARCPEAAAAIPCRCRGSPLEIPPTGCYLGYISVAAFAALEICVKLQRYKQPICFLLGSAVVLSLVPISTGGLGGPFFIGHFVNRMATSPKRSRQSARLSTTIVRKSTESG